MTTETENLYADNTRRLVPGVDHLHRMAAILLAEGTPKDAKMLVLGAGGGQELKAFAQFNTEWSFVGVDPSSEMISLAQLSLGQLVANVDFCQGYISDAPTGLFDGASCLLTLHFLTTEERVQTLREIYKRLKPGAPFVIAHHSFNREPEESVKWLKRYAAFAVASGVPPEQANEAIKIIPEKLPYLSPEEDVRLLEECGFRNIELFYSGFTFKGWICRKPRAHTH